MKKAGLNSIAQFVKTGREHEIRLKYPQKRARNFCVSQLLLGLSTILNEPDILKSQIGLAPAPPIAFAGCTGASRVQSAPQG